MWVANLSSSGGERIEKTLIDPTLLGEKIKEMRLNRKLTQAEVCQNFMTTRALQKIEKGETIPTVEVLLHIANQLQIDMVDLILSSRLPYYFSTKPDSLLSWFDTTHPRITEHDLRALESVVREFATMKLPVNHQIKLQVEYAMMLAFLFDKRKDAYELLDDQLQTIDFEHPPTDLDLFVVAGYIRLEENPLKLNPFIEKLLHYPAYIHYPMITVLLNRIYEQTKEYRAILELSKATLNTYDAEHGTRIIPYIYTQMAGAAFTKEEALAYGTRALMLCDALRYRDEFTMLKQKLLSYHINIDMEYTQVL